MEAIFEGTDSLGIHRESVRVELTKADPGSIQRVADGLVEITLPVYERAEVFCRKLRIDLEAMGFEAPAAMLNYDDDEDDDDPRPPSPQRLR